MDERPIEQLQLFIKARYPILQIVSFEEQRVLESLLRLASESSRPKPVQAWRVTSGWCEGDDRRGDGTLDPLAALNAISDAPQGGLFVLCDYQPYLKDPTVVRTLKDLAFELRQSFKTIILLGSSANSPSDLEKDITVVEYPLPGEAELALALDSVLEAVGSRVEVELDDRAREHLLKAALGLTMREAERAFARAVVARRHLGAEEVELVLEEKEQIVKKSGVLEYVRGEHDLGQVGGLERLKVWLGRRRRAFDDEAREFGLPDPRGLLLGGVQGCGKSLLAKAVARHFELPLLRLDVGRIFSSLVGSSEENLRRALTFAQRVAPAVLWIDEVEKGFSGSRSSGISDGGTSARVFGSFITWLQEKRSPVFVVATANDLKGLPVEITRKGRFDEIFFIDLPHEVERREIFEIHLRLRGRDPAHFALDELSRLSAGYSGAEIEEIVIDGLYRAFEDDRELESEDLREALRQMVPLSASRQEEIEALRGWARGRARPASRPPEEATRQEIPLELDGD